jgi:hypothetical protein
MSHILNNLRSKEEIDEVIRKTQDVVLVLRFGRENDNVCLQLDDIVSYSRELNKFSYETQLYTFSEMIFYCISYLYV